MGDAQLLDAIGVGLGRQEMYNIMLAVKKLGEDPTRGVSSVRFFGKFLGLYSDYYVYETTLQQMPEEEEQPESGEATEVNSGPNAFVYFVSSYPGGPLTQLPSVTPLQIKAARRIKKFLTGRLTSPVSTFPVFPGTEANYLRAQIARIAHTTVCAPNGLFTADEDGNLEREEEFVPVENSRDMALPSNWVHRLPHIKRQGRCQLFVREPPEDEDEEFELTEEEQEEGPEPLTSLEEDTPVMGEAPAWTPLFSSSNENVKNQVAGMRSNLWPGAFVASQGSRFCSVYVGWGVKYEPFVPLPPPPVAREFDQKQVESMELPPKPVAAAAEGEEEED